MVLLSVFARPLLSTLPADSTPEVLQTQGGNAHVLLLDALLILVSFCTLPAYATPNLRPKAGGNARVFLLVCVCVFDEKLWFWPPFFLGGVP